MLFWKFLLGLITFISLMGSLKADAELDLLELDFSINCKILDQILLEVEDGKSSRYAGIDDGLKIGETLVLDIKFVSFKKDYGISIKQRNGSTYPFDSYITNKNFVEILKNHTFSWNHFDEIQNLGNDSMYIGSLLSRLHGARYYKNDWNMLHETHFGQTDKFVRTLNCLNVSNDYNKILDKLVDVHSPTQK
jgi:hypothetical protein